MAGLEGVGGIGEVSVWIERGFIDGQFAHENAQVRDSSLIASQVRVAILENGLCRIKDTWATYANNQDGGHITWAGWRRGDEC